MEHGVVDVFQDIVGKTIAVDVYDKRGVLLFKEGTIIDGHVYNKLMRMGVYYVSVYFSKSSVVKETSSLENFRENYKQDVSAYKGILTSLAAGKDLEYLQVDQLSHSILSKVNSNYLVAECLNQMRSKDEYTYNHSVNVSLYSMLIAKWLKLSQKQIRDVIQAGVLHDIGKAQVPDSILNKKGPLLPAEFEEMKKHSTIGYNLAKRIKGLNYDIAKAVLMHHEREDGHGYPLKVKGTRISLYAKILAVADVYDALTSERCYKHRITPFDTFIELESIGYGHFDPKTLLTFLSNISSYYIGSKVKMNTGDIGQVAYISPHAISKPVVKIGDLLIDLFKNKEYAIVEML